MIAYNSTHEEDSYPNPEYDNLKDQMPEDYEKALAKLKKTAKGRAALKKYKQFWGIPYPTEILYYDLPGPSKVFVGMGRGKARLADGPKGNHRKVKGQRKQGIPVFEPDGKRIWVLSGKNSSASRQELKDAGYVAETHYIPTDDMEAAGTKKAGKYWVHKHDDDGGEWPKVKEDQAGNLVYDTGTYRVTDWIYR